jgi:iron complex outermembrane receptor protein
LKSLGEVAEYTPGAINAGNQLGAGALIKLRGFNPGRAVDGLNTGGLTAFYDPDYAIFDRFEVVKGPTSVVYGPSSPGGLVNFVTKSATPHTIDYVYAQVGSWNSYRVEGQAAGALDSAGRIRVIGVVVRDQGDSFIDVINHVKTTVYGGINVDITDSVTGYLHGGYERFSRTAFDGIPAEPDGSPAPVSQSFFIGAKGMDLKTSAYHAEGDLTWHATDTLDVSVKGNFERTNTVGQTPYAYGLDATGAIALGYQTINESPNDNYGIGVSSIYRLDGLGLSNSFVSLAAMHQVNSQGQNLGYNGGAGNIFGGEAALAQEFESLSREALSPYVYNVHVKVTTVTAQSVAQVITPLSLLVGASYSKPDQTQVYNGVYDDFNFNSRISYRGALIYEVVPTVNAYASFSQSYSPQALQSCTLPQGGTACSEIGTLPPEIGQQYEVGAKYRSSNGRLLMTGALFQVTQQNQGVFDKQVASVAYWKPVGELTHKGVELEVVGQITSQWQIHAGYEFLDPKITKALDSGAAPQGATIGQTELYLPKHTASFYTTYTIGHGFIRGVSFGGGIRYVGAQHTSYDSALANLEGLRSSTITKDLPNYTLVDANVGYTVGKWLLQLNGHNIFDRHYVINNYQTLLYGNFVGTPASVALSVRREF